MFKAVFAQKKVVGAVGMVAGGLGSAQSLEAAVQHQSIDVDIPAEVTDYHVDIDGDALREFDIQVFDTVTKVADFSENGSPTDAFVALDSDGLSAYLAQGTPIDLNLTYGVPTKDR